jgi:hypothetical protein
VGQRGHFKSRGLYFFYGKGNENLQLRIRFFVQPRILSAVKRVEFVSVRVSYIVLRGCRCNIIFFMCVHEVRRKLMIEKTVFTQN